MAIAATALNVQDIARFKIDHADYASEVDNAARRRKIKKLLDFCNFGVNTYKLSKGGVSEYGEPAETQGTGVVDGEAWVFANYDATDDTGKIKAGKPVVFCTKTGICVTGINDKWGVDEYKIVGIALKDYEENGEPKRIPIRLSPSPPVNLTPVSRRDMYIPTSVGENTVAAFDWGAASTNFNITPPGVMPGQNDFQGEIWRVNDDGEYKKIKSVNQFKLYNPYPFQFGVGKALYVEPLTDASWMIKQYTRHKAGAALYSLKSVGSISIPNFTSPLTVEFDGWLQTPLGDFGYPGFLNVNSGIFLPSGRDLTYVGKARLHFVVVAKVIIDYTTPSSSKTTRFELILERHAPSGGGLIDYISLESRRAYDHSAGASQVTFHVQDVVQLDPNQSVRMRIEGHSNVFGGAQAIYNMNCSCNLSLEPLGLMCNS